MTQEYMRPLAGPRATLEYVGGKGASLARLANAGLSVPGGFHIATEAYRRFVADNGLQPAIVEAVRDVGLEEPAGVEAASRAIAGLFAQAAMPPEIAEAIAQAYADLPGEDPSSPPTWPPAPDPNMPPQGTHPRGTALPGAAGG